jgi:hypothetical protein
LSQINRIEDSENKKVKGETKDNKNKSVKEVHGGQKDKDVKEDQKIKSTIAIH